MLLLETGFLLASSGGDVGRSGSFPDGAGVEGKELGGDAPPASGLCPRAPALLLRLRWVGGILGFRIPGGPYGPGLMDLGGICRPGPADREGGTAGNDAGEIGRCGYGGCGGPFMPGRAGDIGAPPG